VNRDTLTFEIQSKVRESICEKDGIPLRYVCRIDGGM
jgi:hypothetical protein